MSEPAAGLFHQLQRLPGFVQCELQFGEPIIHRFKFRLQHQRPFKIIDRVSQAFFLIRDVAEEIIGLLIAGIVAREGFKLFGGLVLFVGAQVDIGQLVPQPRQRRKAPE